MSIHEKLFAVQQALKAPKDQFNSFGKYSYRSCEGVLEALKPLLMETKMTVVLCDTIKEIGGRVYVEASATAYDIENGQSITVTASAREEESKKGMDASQVTGAASSYARKYALNGLFAIDDNKDSDATNNGDKGANSGGKAGTSNYTGQGAKGAQAANTAATAKNIIKCADCGAELHDTKNNDGSPLPVEEYVRKCMDTFGKPLCRNCMKKQR